MAAPADMGWRLRLLLLLSFKLLRAYIPSFCFFLLSFILPISIKSVSDFSYSSFVEMLISFINGFPGNFVFLVQSQNSHSIVHWSLNRASLISEILSKYSLKTGISIAIGYSPPSRQ